MCYDIMFVVGMFLTEFSESNNSDDDDKSDMFVQVADAADNHILSWTMWEYKSFCSETDATLSGTSQQGAYGACKTGYGGELIYNADGELNIPACKKLARTYAQKTAGEISVMKFDSLTSNFEMQYVINTGISLPTEIFAHQSLRYSSGMDVEIYPKGSNYLHVNLIA